MRAVALAVLLVGSGCTGALQPVSAPPLPPAVTAAAALSAPPSPVASASPVPSRTPTPSAGPVALREFAVGRGQGPHDVAPAKDGGVWYTAQHSGELGWLDPATGRTRMVKLGAGSAPHGVIVGPDGAPWITDGGLNAIVRVDPVTNDVRSYPLPAGRPRANLNTAVFARDGTLWFTGQAGIYGSLDPRTGGMRVFDAPRGVGPYGITATADGAVWYASLAGSYLGRIDPATGAATALDPPTRGQGARRVWSDSRGQLWIAEWNAGSLARYDPATATWKEWKLAGSRPMAYAVYVDADDVVWITEWGAGALVRFEPLTERFTAFPFPANANVRQLAGRIGEVWGAESGLDRLVLATTDATR